MIKDVVIIGYSGHAYVLIDVLHLNHYKVYGYCDREEKQKNPYRLTYLGSEVKDAVIKVIGNYLTVVSIGDNNIREQIFNHLNKNSIQIQEVIHPSATISSTAIIGTGAHIMGSVTINSFAEIGQGVICNTACVIEHECSIGNFSHIAPGAVLAGNVQIGARSFIGANAVIKQGIKVGNNVVVGAGSVVINDIPDHTIVAGNPAKLLKPKI